MSWSITVAGTIRRNDLTNPNGERKNVLGGSAIYFPLIASAYTQVNVYAIGGIDTERKIRKLLSNKAINTDGYTISNLATPYERGVQDFNNWTAKYQLVDRGCDREWVPRLSVLASEAKILFLGSLSPKLQQELLAQSRADLIGVDNMTSFMQEQPEIFEAVVDGADILFLDRVELAMFTDSDKDNWAVAAQSLLKHGRLRAVIVKAGPLGAACVTEQGVIEKPALPVPKVMDPTGAGDTLAGGFLGACANAERDDVEFFPTALEHGMCAAALGITDWGTTAIQNWTVPRIS